MCDYSLENVASRPAVVGDKLTVTRFYSATTGFSAADDEKVAVCLLPGTELAFDAPVSEYQFRDKKYEHTVAVFTQIIRPEMTFGYHKDGLEFSDGQRVLLNELAPGQTATVLQLPAQGIEKLPGQSVMDHLELAPGCDGQEARAKAQDAVPFYAEIV